MVDFDSIPEEERRLLAKTFLEAILIFYKDKENLRRFEDEYGDQSGTVKKQ